MPKATRANDSNETPKKRSRKTQPGDGNGTSAVEPVTTAPAIAQTTPKIAQQEQEASQKPSHKPNGVAATGAEPVQPVAAEPTIAVTVVRSEVSRPSVPGVSSGVSSAVSKEAAAPARHNGNGHVSEESVRRRAYELYLQRRGQGGSAEQDWFQALQEISGRHAA